MSLTDQFPSEISLDPVIVSCNKGTLTEADLGKPVKLAAGNVAELGQNNEEIIGVLATFGTDVVGVKLAGLVTMPYKGADPVIGKNKLVVNNQGGCKVRGASTFPEILVTDVDTAAKTVSFILNNA